MIILYSLSGWEFVDLVMTSHQSFRGFVTVMNNKLRRYSESSFMGVNSFINWFFGWTSRMKIEFRQSCTWCEGPSKVLACDGTKLGIGFRNCFVSPIENASTPIPEGYTALRRHDRCFIPTPSDASKESKRDFALARATLKDVSLNVLKDIYPELATVNFLRPYIPIMCQYAFDRMLSPNETPAIKKSFALVFKLLSHDCAVDTVVPYSVCQKVLNINEGSISELANELAYFSREFTQLLRTCFNENALQDAVLLLKHCAIFVNNYHFKDIQPSPSSPIAGSYNPAKYGRAYYFSEHGSQIRPMRKFPIDGPSNTSANFDDAPDVLCQKKFPQVSKQGTSYLFLWFCPLHGHCYGFHVIPDSEGRKDPAASLYTHLENAPELILYDFACSLSEYCKNRESGYYQNTRFCHDIFHGFTHKCSQAFRCDKLLGTSELNTSICEQFNSFIQKIKSSSKLMTQCHFTFYLQFFIHIWNEEKSKNFKKKNTISIESKKI